MVLKHCGYVVSLGKSATENISKEVYEWHNMKKSINEFVQNFLHCIMLRIRERVPKFLAKALHG